MEAFQKIAQAINIIHLLWYWFALIIFDFGILKKRAIKKRYSSHKLSMNFWLPFGVVVPILWALQQKFLSLWDVLVIVGMILFFGVLAPIFYNKHLKQGLN